MYALHACMHTCMIVYTVTLPADPKCDMSALQVSSTRLYRRSPATLPHMLQEPATGTVIRVSGPQIQSQHANGGSTPATSYGSSFSPR